MRSDAPGDAPAAHGSQALVVRDGGLPDVLSVPTGKWIVHAITSHHSHHITSISMIKSPYQSIMKRCHNSPINSFHELTPP